MNGNTQRLIDLLPAIYRIRDEEQGGPLREVLDVIGEQFAALEEDVEQLYDDQFIETCADWVVPYIGDLIGYRSLHHKSPRLESPRAEVANTIGYRRRKGTAAMLEQLAHDVTGWPAKVVEFFQLVATTQFMNHIRLHSTLTPDLRRWEKLETLDGPFDSRAHSVDTRRIATRDGKYNIPNIGIFLWRLGAHRLLRSPPVQLDPQRFFFGPLGMNTRLFSRPVTEPTVTHLARHENVPAPVTRRRMDAFLDAYYGNGKSVFIEGVPSSAVIICNLSDQGAGWAHTPPPAGKIAIDPVLGRIAFGDPQPSPPAVTFHYGFSANLGGGEYERAASFDLPPQPLQSISSPGSIQAAIGARVSGRAIEITDNGRYVEALSLNVNPGEHFELRAANERRPTIVLGGELVIAGGDKAADVTFNGIVFAGARIRLTGIVRQLRFRHCTLVPGRSLDSDGTPTQQPAPPSLVIENGEVTTIIEHCICGPIQWHDLGRLEIRDSIIDATATENVALCGVSPEPMPAGQLAPAAGTLRVEESTVIGKVHVHMMELISNSLFTARTQPGDGWPAPFLARRKQTGCVRFSFMPEGALTPRRFRCQPDLEIASRLDAAEKEAQSKGQSLTSQQREAIRIEVKSWLQPSFMSLRYGDPAYAQMRARSPRQLREGADDESAMGSFHDVFEPQRITNLQIRLKDLRFGLEAGVFTVT